AQVTNGGAEEMLVLPAGLRIENSAGSRASYRVTLPASVRRVTVRVGQAEARSVVVGGSGWSEEVRLSRSRARRRRGLEKREGRGTGSRFRAPLVFDPGSVRTPPRTLPAPPHPGSRAASR